MPLLLTEADVRAVLGMADLIDAMERALAAFSCRAVVQPVRHMLDIADRGGLFALMPAYLGSAPAMGAKLVTVYPGNLEKGLTSHLATIVLLDPDTGALEAILDGRYITEARTAAVSAVSVKKLARRDARVLGIIGSGVQARSHVEALAHVRNFEEIRAWSPTRANLEAFAKESGARAVASAEEAARGADVIVLVTGSEKPVVHNDWVKPGAHVISVGACRPTQREMDPALVKRSRLFVDSRTAAAVESGDVIGAGADHIVAELGESSAARRSDDEVTVFKSLGLAVEDVVAADLAVKRARAGNRGTEL